MDEFDHRIASALQQTQVLRPPKRHLATFGATDLRYYLVTTPIYSDLVPGTEESVVRDGKVVSQRPAIVTPTYMLNLEGFGDDARQYMESMVMQYGPNSPGLLYQYRNEPGGLEIVGGEAHAVAQRIADDLDQRGVDSAAVIMGADELWDLSLMKFIYDYTTASLSSNVDEIQAMGLLDPHPDVEVPRGAVQRIESLFRQVERGSDPQKLHRELTRWGLFEHYQDRFLGLFRRK
ncbi:MAG: hypothetical protein QF714_01615 [Dehalococcoidia bacterium]|jgi:hypothetical protein|nr:hypothetical protein [Dehalococcoidia bacterium]MDP6226396.1 hypothetical protein [Dehalococcoidia bacterium]MDP7202298.1 hypothetical protein [Dehalococcoidia bacterium]HJN88251.1 hypothetical protein [Dehalococcoidia bacterium]